LGSNSVKKVMEEEICPLCGDEIEECECIE
jgi:hypothetical protein